jgi:type II restriction/modification system DNA methylase subunit YeeA
MWIIDFAERQQSDAALYEAPFEHVREHVRPMRLKGRRRSRAEKWWLHGETGSGMRRALAGLKRYIATPAVAKHRLFVWLPVETLADHQLIVIAREDEFTFGVLHSRPHELWSRAMGTQLREAETGFRYTHTSTFMTFPFPRPSKKQETEIAAAAKAIHELREGWLNPKDLSEAELKKRTLTNLYNARPAWLVQAHDRLDRAVLDAYGWPHDISDDDLLARLLALNLEREPA